MSFPSKTAYSELAGPDGMVAKLRSWALEEMQFRPQGRHVGKSVPSMNDFKMLCRGTMMDIWGFVLTHIRSVRTVEKVCGNLKLQDSLTNPASANNTRRPAAVEKLKQMHSTLSQELAELTKNIQRVEKEISSLTKEIQASEQGYTELCDEVSNVDERASLLEAHSQQCRHVVQMYEGVAEQLTRKLTDCKDPSSRKASTDPTYYSIKGILAGAQTAQEGRATPPGLESVCTKHVRETCEKIGSFLHQVCDAEIDESKSGRVGDGQTVQVKDKLWTGVEDVLSCHPPEDTLTSLSRVAQDSALNLRELAGRIDLKRDAEELKFKYETTGQLTDRSSPPSLLQSVHQLIEEGQALHIQRFLESEQADTEAWRARQRLQTTQQELHARLAARHRHAPGDAELARALLHNQLELAATEASLAFIKSTLDELGKTRTAKQAAHDQLIAKHKKIEDFQTLSERKQMLIQTLVKQNYVARERVEKQKHEVLEYVQRKVCSHVGHVTALVAGLQDSVAQEVARFSAVPLDDFRFADVDSSRRIAAKELSIRRLVDLAARPGGPSIEALLNTLDFPSFKAPEELLPAAVAMKMKVLEAELALQAKDNYAVNDEENSVDRMSQKLNVLRCDVEQHDRAQLDTVLPAVERGLAQATEGLSDCIAVRDAVTAWWEQPAQFAVPWVSADEMSMRQWLDQWTLSATRLRQLQMNR